MDQTDKLAASLLIVRQAARWPKLLGMSYTEASNVELDAKEYSVSVYQ